MEFIDRWNLSRCGHGSIGQIPESWKGFNGFKISNKHWGIVCAATLWSLWEIRNAKIFKHQMCSIKDVVKSIKSSHINGEENLNVFPLVRFMIGQSPLLLCAYVRLKPVTQGIMLGSGQRLMQTPSRSMSMVLHLGNLVLQVAEGFPEITTVMCGQSFIHHWHLRF